jgi:hypothetical protein
LMLSEGMSQEPHEQRGACFLILASRPMDSFPDLKADAIGLVVQLHSIDAVVPHEGLHTCTH